MIQTEVQATGIILPDGSLKLDSPLDMPSGRVRVLVRVESPMVGPTNNTFWDALCKAKESLRSVSRPVQDRELEKYVDSLRESDPTDDWLMGNP